MKEEKEEEGKGKGGAWPPELKSFVNATFAKCTDANRQKVEAELKSKIFEAFSNNTIYTTNWMDLQLESLKPTAKRKKNAVAQIPSAQLSALKASTSGTNGIATANAASQEELNLRQKRQRRFDKEAELANGGPSPATPIVPIALVKKTAGKAQSLQKSVGGLSLREQRFLSGTPDPVFNPDVIEWDSNAIVGLSRQLEKPYFRLTSAPDPNTVRPVAVLKQTLEHLKVKWRKENNYAWVCDQFKSMRQDLTVQRVKNDFTVQVYEIHARIALEKGDLGEYNQCQSQLRELYKHGLKGHPMEFLAYRILYQVHTRNRSDFSALLANLTAEERDDECVKHALAVRTAVATSNYHQFFKLFRDAPKMGPYMMDHFLGRERVNALVTISKAYMRVPLSYITDALAFDTSADAHAFLQQWQAAIYVPEPPAPPIHAKPISISLAGAPKIAKPKVKEGKMDLDKPAEDRRILDCKLATGPLMAAAQTFQKVDIKGQI